MANCLAIGRSRSCHRPLRTTAARRGMRPAARWHGWLVQPYYRHSWRDPRCRTDGCLDRAGRLVSDAFRRMRPALAKLRQFGGSKRLSEVWSPEAVLVGMSGPVVKSCVPPANSCGLAANSCGPAENSCGLAANSCGLAANSCGPAENSDAAPAMRCARLGSCWLDGCTNWPMMAALRRPKASERSPPQGQTRAEARGVGGSIFRMAASSFSLRGDDNACPIYFRAIFVPARVSPRIFLPLVTRGAAKSRENPRQIGNEVTSLPSEWWRDSVVSLMPNESL